MSVIYENLLVFEVYLVLIILKNLVKRGFQITIVTINVLINLFIGEEKKSFNHVRTAMIYYHVNFTKV